jgi:hypothetical protein
LLFVKLSASGPSQDASVIEIRNDNVREGIRVQASENSGDRAFRNEKETRPGLLTQLRDSDFLRSIGVAPYEPEFFEYEIRARRRDRVIQVFALLQLAAMAAALIWTAV